MIDEIFMVFERLPNGQLATNLTTGPYHGTKDTWTSKKRVFFNRTQADVYRKRLEKQNRKGLVVRFVPDTEIE